LSHDGLVETYEQALAFLDARIGRGVDPGLDRIRGAMELMTSPHEAYPVIHVAGTNGKTTVTRMIERILGGVGMRVGTYTSPHLQAIEDRFTFNAEPFTPERFTTAIADVAPFIEIYEQQHGTTLTYFEVTVAVALQAFAAEGIDVAVVEVGLGGRLDATNVVTGEVSIVTSIGLDHTDQLGNTLAEIATEKVAILDPGKQLVTGPLPAAAEGAITARVAETGATWSMTGREFSVIEASPAVGGWQATIEGIYDTYEGLYLPLHGRHQVDNLATAIAACERFFGKALDLELLQGAVGRIASAGRIEVVSHRPLVILDGSHNLQGLEALATTLVEEFLDATRILVVAMRGNRDVAEVLAPLAGLFDRVIVTAADDPHAIDPDVIAEAVVQAFGPDVLVEVEHPAVQALTEALSHAGEDDMVVVTGSLYLVGEVRDRLS
jgi:dihydrofolate synthase/folylpolyglutamate synthase